VRRPRATRVGVPWITAALAVGALVLHGVADPSALAYRPDAPTAATLLGCHLVHWTPTHLAWDLTTFVVAGVVTERWRRDVYVLFLGAAALLVPPVVGLADPALTHYAGLSGLVLGQVALGLALGLGCALRERQTLAAAALAVGLAVLLGKQVLEVVAGGTTLVALDYDGFRTVPAAHLASVIVGGLAGCADLVVAGERGHRLSQTG